MTFRTFNRTGPALLMAAFAIGVKGITPFGITVWPVAILTTTRHSFILFFVMAIIARNTIPRIVRMRFVIKQDLSRGALKHEPYRFFRFFL